MPREVRFVLLGWFLTVGPIAAGPFQIRNRATDLDLTDPGELALYQAFDSAANAIETEVNSNILSSEARQTLADNMARASSSTLSALVFDRTSEPREVSVGVGAQFNAYAENDTFRFSGSNSVPAVGVGGQTSLSFGLRASYLGLPPVFGLDPRRLYLHFNLMRFSVNISSIHYSVFNAGIGLKYVAIPARGNWGLRWGGVSWGTGLQYSNSDVLVRMRITDSQTTPVGGETATTSSDLECSVGANSQNVYLPMEVSTSLTFLNTLTLFVAVALDVNFGRSETIGSASGPIQSTYSGNVAGVSNYFSADAHLDMANGPSASPSLFIARTTGGLNVSVSPLNLAAELSWLSNGVYSAATNLRVVF